MSDQKLSALGEGSYPPGATDYLYGIQGGSPVKFNPKKLGGKVLLDEQVASASSLLASTAFSNSYDDYELELIDIVAGTNAVGLSCQFGTGGGPTYLTSAYRWIRNQAIDTDSSPMTLTVSNSDSAISLFNALSNNAANGFNGSYLLRGLRNSAVRKTMGGKGWGYYSAGALFLNDISSGNDGTTVITAVKVFPASGNIASGIYRLYGLVKA